VLRQIDNFLWENNHFILATDGSTGSYQDRINACRQSHIEAMTKIYRASIIVEDDVQFTDNFPYVQHTWSREIPEDYDIIFWAWRAAEPPLTRPHSEHFFRLVEGDVSSALCYQIHGPRAAYKIISLLDGKNGHVDLLLFDFVKRGMINAFFATHPQATQAGFPSTIKHEQ
jgi:GR25 family glycosyltransferase involved in LPS biosynthesis